MLKDNIKEFEERYHNFVFNEFLIDFEEGKIAKDLCVKYGIGISPLRSFIASLGLDFIKSRRMRSVEQFKYRLGLETGDEDINVLKEMSRDYDVLAEKNRKLYQALTLSRDENNALRKESREEARNKDIVAELMQDFNQTLTNIKPITTTFKLVDRETLRDSKVQPFVLLSDLHYNEVIQGKYIEDYNEFNNDICLEGIDKVLEAVQLYEGDILRIYLGGDLLSGIIHNLDLRGQVPVTQSVVELAKFLADRINTLATQYSKIKVIMVNGNHSRIHGKPVTDLKAFDFEHLMYEIMLASFTEANIESSYSLSTFALDNVGTEDTPKYVALFHGDNKGFNPTQESSVLKQLNIMDELFGVRVVSTISGHTHKPMFVPNSRGGTCIINGCTSASSEYGFNNNFLPIQPYQWVGTWNVKGYADDCKCVRIR